MTLLLELNDLGVRCYRDGELLLQSPGVAITHDQLVLGDDAWQQSRLHPLNTYTEFWSQLNTQPVTCPHPQVRHHGDLAYLHLQHIESQLPLSFKQQDVVFALPGSMERGALSLLLGIAQQCGLQPIGLVDQALATSLPHVRETDFWHLEMHLHHSVATRLSVINDQLQRQQVEILRDQGWLTLHTRALQFLSDQFIRQTRFDPRHNADSEQQLFNAIPDCLQQAKTQSSLSIEHQQHQIDIEARALIDHITAGVKSLMSEIPKKSNSLYLGDRLAQWQFLLADNPVKTFDQPQQIAAMSALSEHVSRHPEGVRFITSLPCSTQTEVDRKASKQPATKATHVLWKNRAYPLSGLYSLKTSGELVVGEISDAALYIQQGELRAGLSTISLNNQPLQNQPLYSGDQIQIKGLAEPLTLIEVTD